MRLSYATQAAAQAKADAIHAWMMANDPAYIATAWAKPYQDYVLNATGDKVSVSGTAWYVNVKERCLRALSASEKAALQ